MTKATFLGAYFRSLVWTIVPVIGFFVLLLFLSRRPPVELVWPAVAVASVSASSSTLYDFLGAKLSARLPAGEANDGSSPRRAWRDGRTHGAHENTERKPSVDEEWAARFLFLAAVSFGALALASMVATVLQYSFTMLIPVLILAIPMVGMAIVTAVRLRSAPELKITPGVFRTTYANRDLSIPRELIKRFDVNDSGRVSTELSPARTGRWRLEATLVDGSPIELGQVKAATQHAKHWEQALNRWVQSGDSTAAEGFAPPIQPARRAAREFAHRRIVRLIEHG